MVVSIRFEQANRLGVWTMARTSEVEIESASFVPTGIAEFDRVLGGGMVAGSAVLLGGDPGIGKSTLLLQATVALTTRRAERVLYVSGEESPGQIVGRASRLGLPAKALRLLAETQVEHVLAHAANEKPRVLVIDSIQTMHTELLQSAPGGVAQGLTARAAVSPPMGIDADTVFPIFLIFRSNLF